MNHDKANGEETLFFIVDIRKDWRRHKYITFWRPNNANYAWPLSWAGRYDKATIDAQGWYYCNTNGGPSLVRFPVQCEVVESMALTKPDRGDIDGNAGPVLRNSEKVRRKLRASAYIPPGAACRSLRKIGIVTCRYPFRAKWWGDEDEFDVDLSCCPCELASFEIGDWFDASVEFDRKLKRATRIFSVKRLTPRADKPYDAHQLAQEMKELDRISPDDI